MKEQFCTYKIALKLKELGFDEDVLAYYTSEKKLKYTDSHLSIRAGQWLLKAPLWQQAIDWLREKHNLFIELTPYNKLFHWDIIKIDGMFPYGISEKRFLYYEAREAAILKAIELCKKI